MAVIAPPDQPPAERERVALAGQVDHIISLTDPYPDIDINIRGTATVMEACRQHNPNILCPYGVYETSDRGAFLLAVAFIAFMLVAKRWYFAAFVRARKPEA